MTTVKETVDSGIAPIVLEFSKVNFFESDRKILRSFLTVNSLDLGVLGYSQYRFVARRTKVGNRLVRRHLEKLFRLLPDLLAKEPDITCVTVPVYARLLGESELAEMLVDISSLYPEVPLGRICIELSADILYEDLEMASEKINELRNLGVKVAIFEVGDKFCPVFRLSEIAFDYAFMDVYSTKSLENESAERVAGSLVKYLHHLDAKVIAPGLDTEKKIETAKALGTDGYTKDYPEGLYNEDYPEGLYAEGGADE